MCGQHASATEQGLCRDMAFRVATRSAGRLDGLGHDRVFLCCDGAHLAPVSRQGSMSQHSFVREGRASVATENFWSRRGGLMGTQRLPAHGARARQRM